MNDHGESIRILMADDDPEDLMLAKVALEKNRLANTMDCVEDGEELLEYLQRRGKYTELKGQPLPGLILPDLNMPRKDGREALKEIKEDPELKRIPVVVLTTSEAEEDILGTYDLGVSGFISKPVALDGLIKVMKSLSDYWLDIVKLPVD